MFSIAKTNVNWSHHACGHRPHIQNDKTKKEAKKNTNEKMPHMTILRGWNAGALTQPAVEPIMSSY